MAGDSVSRARRSGGSFAYCILTSTVSKGHDRFGHEAGDYSIGNRCLAIQGTLRASDFRGSARGDEFVAVLLDAKEPPGAEALIDRLTETFGRPGSQNWNEGDMSVSIGQGGLSAGRNHRRYSVAAPTMRCMSQRRRALRVGNWIAISFPAMAPPTLASDSGCRLLDRDPS